MSTTDPIESYRERYVIRSQGDAAEETVKSHVRYLRMFEDWLQERDMDLNSEIDVDTFLKFKRDLQEENEYAEGTMRKAIGAISRFFKIERPDATNPVEDWETSGKEGKWTITTEKEKEVREGVFYLDETDVKALLDGTNSLRDRLIIRLLVSTGIRRSELVTLRERDVDPAAKEIHIYEKKNDRYRTVGFRSDKLARDLRMWLDHGRAGQYGAKTSEYLLPNASPNTTKDHLSAATVVSVVEKAADDADIQRVYTTDSQGRERNLVTPHCLRATFAVQCAKAGISAPYVQEACGHSDLAVTQIYLSVKDDDAADVIRDRGPSF